MNRRRFSTARVATANPRARAWRRHDGDALKLEGVLEASVRTCAEVETTLFWDILFLKNGNKLFYLPEIRPKSGPAENVPSAFENLKLFPPGEKKLFRALYTHIHSLFL